MPDTPKKHIEAIRAKQTLVQQKLNGSYG